MQLQHQGYAFKLPVYGFTNEDNSNGQLLTYGLFALANLVTYKLLRYKKDQQPFLKSQKYQIALGYYLT